MSHNYKLTIAYDGTRYHGWQVQPNGLSIQEILQSKMAIILRQKISLIGSGRTDAGVHAIAQVANFQYPNPLDFRRFLLSINGMIPPDIRVTDICEVPLSFHAQHGAKKKIYHYHIHLGKTHDPFNRLFSTHFPHSINLDLMKAAAQHFVGTHDFTSFSNQSHTGSAAIDPVRTIYRLDIIEEPGGLRLEFEGNGFLYKMVRNIVGSLLDVAIGKIKVESIEHILLAKDRRKACQAAPAEGLFLVEVLYT